MMRLFAGGVTTPLVVKIRTYGKVPSLDIATLLGAEGPQQGPQGPKVPEGPQPSAGARRMGT